MLAELADLTVPDLIATAVEPAGGRSGDARRRRNIYLGSGRGSLGAARGPGGDTDGRPPAAGVPFPGSAGPRRPRLAARLVLGSASGR